MSNGQNPYSTVKLTPEKIKELTDVLKKMEGKEMPEGVLMDLNPGGTTAWYIAYSTSK